MTSTLTIDAPVPFVIPDGPLRICLVGCGGTGSHIAQALARIAAHTASRELALVFMDGDVVEPKNVGRQLFSSADVGHNKAQVLAARFNHLFGLRIDAVPDMATAQRLREIGGKSRRTRTATTDQWEGRGILIGAVDTATARRSIHSALSQSCWSIWLDCGNHEYAGQVSVGTTTSVTQVRTAILGGICTALPAPSLIDPEILAATPPRRRIDCAAAMEDNLQGLMVNQQVAAIAATYLEHLICRRQITSLRTSFSQMPLAMRSTPITVANIEAVMTAYQIYQQQQKETV